MFQIRYRGYKVVLMLDSPMETQTWVKFRRSMKKFHGGDDHSFSVVEHSKVACSSLLSVILNKNNLMRPFSPTFLAI